MLENIIMIVIFIVAFAYILKGAIKGSSGCSTCSSKDFCGSENNSSENSKKEINIPINNLTKRKK